MWKIRHRLRSLAREKSLTHLIIPMTRRTLGSGRVQHIVVAHRGGAKELGEAVPDNSIASLDYAMSLGCYASECDIYMTTDRRVIVAHVDGEGMVNGYYPFMATLDELRAAGTLSNGEDIPTLEEYLDHVMKKGSCTRLWLDIKNVTKPSTLSGLPRGRMQDSL